MVPWGVGREWRGKSKCVCRARHCSSSCLASAFVLSLAVSDWDQAAAHRGASSRSILCEQRIHRGLGRFCLFLRETGSVNLVALPGHCFHYQCLDQEHI